MTKPVRILFGTVNIISDSFNNTSPSEQIDGGNNMTQGDNNSPQQDLQPKDVDKWLKRLDSLDNRISNTEKKSRFLAMAIFGGSAFLAGISTLLASTGQAPVLWGKVAAVIGFLFVAWALCGLCKVRN